jgi:hypothetical protein
VNGGAGKPKRVRAAITIDELERWEEHGATWRAVEVSDARAVVELCTCYGEPVDMRESESPELIEFVRSQITSRQPQDGG